MGGSPKKTQAKYYDPPYPMAPSEVAVYLTDSANGFVYRNIKKENLETGGKRSWRVEKNGEGKLTVFGLDPYLQQEIILGEFQADSASEDFGLWDVDNDEDFDLVFQKEGQNYFSLSNYSQIQKLSRIVFGVRDERLTGTHKHFARKALELLGVMEPIDLDNLLSGKKPQQQDDSKTPTSFWTYQPTRLSDYFDALQSHPTFGVGVTLAKGLATLVSEMDLKEAITQNAIADYMFVYSALNDRKKAEELAYEFATTQRSPGWSTKGLFENAIVQGGTRAENALLLLRTMNLEMWMEDPLPLIRPLCKRLEENSQTVGSLLIEVLARPEFIRSPLAQRAIADTITQNPELAYAATKPTGVFPFDLHRFPEAKEKLFECALNVQNAARKFARQNCFAALASTNLSDDEEDQLARSAKHNPLPGYALVPLIRNPHGAHSGIIFEAGLWSLQDSPQSREPDQTDSLAEAMARRFFVSKEIFSAVGELHGWSANPFTIFSQSLDLFPERTSLKHYPMGSHWYTDVSPTKKKI